MAISDAIFKQLRKNAGKADGDQNNKLRGKTALIISAFAAVYSINVFLQNRAASTVLNNTIEASNTWAFYQAKNIRQTQYIIAADALEGSTAVQDRQRLVEYRATIDRYENEPGEGKRALIAKARQIEAERDVAKKRVPWYGMAGSIMQIAIVLLTASMLTAGLLMFWGGIAAQAAALAFMAQAYFLWF